MSVGAGALKGEGGEAGVRIEGDERVVRRMKSTSIVQCVIVLFFFFFSSRRRHTRSDRDWSSDVCSSDLIVIVIGVGSAFTMTIRAPWAAAISVSPATGHTCNEVPTARKTDRKSVV